MNCILVTCSAQIQEIFPLKEGLVKIGRESDNDIQLLEEAISRYHAEVSNMPNVCEIRDCNSSNGTYVNGQKTQTAILRHRDEIRLGDTVFRFEQVEHEVSQDMSSSRNYSALSQHSTVRVKRHPADLKSPTPMPDTTTIPAPQITIKKKKEE
jgi:pSer/pThr/pTyr-binding forkhead associated (FHA) protein